MTLTYTHTERSYNETREERELKAPKHWGMFTSAGNSSLRKKAERLIFKLERLETKQQKQNALLAFLRSYRRMGDTKTMREADDTEVRECVWSFFEKACMASGMSDAADYLWDLHE